MKRRSVLYMLAVAVLPDFLLRPILTRECVALYGRKDWRPRVCDIREEISLPRDIPFGRMAKGTAFLDGRDITDERVVYANESLGLIESQAMDEDGNPFLDENHEVVMAPRRYGQVRIYLPDEMPSE